MNVEIYCVSSYYIFFNKVTLCTKNVENDQPQ